MPSVHAIGLAQKEIQTQKYNTGASQVGKMFLELPKARKIKLAS